ncbi:MAG TPA: BlaI/MecI/CopY family transcriptional regulator [Pirellulales bacterium]|jgi:predicted transcriptional regulator
MMVRRAGLSKAELEVARIVWSLGGATVRQVFDALPTDRTLDYKTVQTYLRRLEAKGYLATRREGKSTHYRPRIRPTQVVRETVADFVSRLFDGDALPLVECLIADHKLTAEDIARLRDILNQREQKDDEHSKR